MSVLFWTKSRLWPNNLFGQMSSQHLFGTEWGVSTQCGDISENRRNSNKAKKKPMIFIFFIFKYTKIKQRRRHGDSSFYLLEWRRCSFVARLLWRREQKAHTHHTPKGRHENHMHSSIDRSWSISFPSRWSLLLYQNWAQINALECFYFTTSWSSWCCFCQTRNSLPVKGLDIS